MGATPQRDEASAPDRPRHTNLGGGIQRRRTISDQSPVRPLPRTRRLRTPGARIDSRNARAALSGRIATPTDWNGTDKYRVTNYSYPSGSVRAVGRTSGMTTGSVVYTCYKTTITDMPGIMQLCAYGATYISQPGDSGGPVFRVTNSPSANDVTFVGLNWGSAEIGGQQIGVISAWPLARFEMQPYDVRICATGFAC